MQLNIKSAPHIEAHAHIVGSVCDDSNMVCQEDIVADIHKDVWTLMSNMALVDTINCLNINF